MPTGRPVLAIRTAQVAAFRTSAVDDFERRLATHLRKYFPRHCAMLGEAGVGDAVRAGRTLADTAGHVSEREVCYYLVLCVMLGAGFADDPQLPWIAPLIETTDGAARLAAVYAAASAYFNGVAGPRNEHFVKAMVRVRALRLDDVSRHPVGDDRFVDDVAATLARLYPQKAERQGLAVTRAVVEASREIAAAHDLREAPGTALVAGLMFFQGHRVMDDPFHPWIAQALAEPADDETARVDHLQAGVRRFVDVALS